MPTFTIEQVSTSDIYKEITHVLVVVLDDNETLSDAVIKMIDCYTESVKFRKRTKQPLSITCSTYAFARFQVLKYISFECVIEWHKGLERMFDLCNRLQLLQVCGKTNNDEVNATMCLMTIKYLLLNGYGIVNGFDNVIENVEKNGGKIIRYY